MLLPGLSGASAFNECTEAATVIVHRHSVSEVPDLVMRSRSEAATGPIAGIRK